MTTHQKVSQPFVSNLFLTRIWAKLNFRKYVSGVNSALYLTTERVLQVIATLITSAVIARSVSLPIFGEWQLAITSLFLLATLANVASYEVTLPLLKRYNKNKTFIVSVAIQLRLAAASIFFLLMLLGSYAIFFDNHFLIILLLLLPLIFREPWIPIVMLLIGEGRLKHYFIISMTSLIVKIILTLLLYFFIHPTYYWYIFPSYIENIIYVYFLITIGNGYKMQSKLNISKKIKKIIFNRSLLGWLFTLIIMLSLRIDRLIMPTLASAKEFAFYAAVGQINDNFYYVGTILVNSLAPLYIYHADKKICTRRAVTMALSCAFFLFLLAIGITYYAEIIILPVYGEKFREATPLLSVSCWAAILLPLDMLLATPLVYKGRLKLLTCKAIFSLISISILIITLFPYYGIYSGPLALGLTFLMDLCIISYFLWGLNRPFQRS